MQKAHVLKLILFKLLLLLFACTSQANETNFDEDVAQALNKIRSTSMGPTLLEKISDDAGALTVEIRRYEDQEKFFGLFLPPVTGVNEEKNKDGAVFLSDIGKTKELLGSDATDQMARNEFTLSLVEELFHAGDFKRLLPSLRESILKAIFKDSVGEVRKRVSPPSSKDRYLLHMYCYFTELRAFRLNKKFMEQLQIDSPKSTTRTHLLKKLRGCDKKRNEFLQFDDSHYRTIENSVEAFDNIADFLERKFRDFLSRASLAGLSQAVYLDFQPKEYEKKTSKPKKKSQTLENQEFSDPFYTFVYRPPIFRPTPFTTWRFGFGGTWHYPPRPVFWGPLRWGHSYNFTF